ncbi:MAG: hypothetical protein MJY82_08525 [Fibrobacter sp.]|nr:hypothetical protein [Fibrobacter sp.]
MGSFFFWLLVVVCVIALVVLFFPVRFKLEFEAGEKGGLARLFLYKKLLWSGEKKWKKEDKEKKVNDKVSSKEMSSPKAEPVPKPKAEPAAEPKVAPVMEPKAEPAVEPKSKPVPEPKAESAPGISTAKKKSSDWDLDDDDDVSDDCMPTYVATKPTPREEMKCAKPSVDASPKPTVEPKPKKEKRKLTDREFWTILLTPDMDARAFRYVRHLLWALVKILRLKFEDCFVEGIRADYRTMGYGAAANGCLKGFPYLEAWDFRMDWCHEKELHAQGAIRLDLNLCRVLAFLLKLVVYAGILLFLFWRRRARYFKTNELPELGFVRQKILGWIVEE